MLIQHGTVVFPDGEKKSDIRIVDGRIAETGELKPLSGETVMDAAGKYIVPGGIDAHTHLDMPCGDIHTADGFLAGSRAAVAGGTTTVIEYAECEQGQPLQEGLENWRRKADGQSYCDYGFHMTVSCWTEDSASQMTAMTAAGVTSFKIYTAYQSDIGVTDSELYRILQQAGKLQALVCAHCENDGLLRCLGEDLESRRREISAFPDSRPNLVEAEAIHRVADFGAAAHTPVYIVHISTAEGVRILQNMQADGQRVYGETCPHYLLLDDSLYHQSGFEGAKYVMSPPLRKKRDQDALWSALQDGTVQVVSTDHCAFRFSDQKMLGKDDFRKIPSGIPSVEHRLELMYSFGLTHGMTLVQIAAATAANPADIFGLSFRKGRIAPGLDADLVILSLDCPHIITAADQLQCVDYTPYEGRMVSAKVDTVFLRGRQIAQREQLREAEPFGIYTARKTSSAFLQQER